MKIKVQLFSYLKDAAPAAEFNRDVPAGTTLGEFLSTLHQEFPKLAAMRKSTLAAVGVDYQTPDYILHDNDEVSLFPPVQGG